ncbi:MAG: T9SS type A sorting domain-containing protein [Saprospiraceae bacterium]|nr:T9SS type A sorting domain-containing protein [Saprospiraceae bacterium]
MRIAIALFSIFSCLVFLSNKGGRNQPTTGASFENSAPACAECHSGGSYQPTLAIALKDSLGNEVDAYRPNSTYTLEMQIASTSGNPKTYGFQAVMVDEAGVQAGSFVSLGDKVRKLTLQNRVYLTQISPVASGLFTAKWQAPAVGKPLKLYIAGLATNNNNNTSGDKGAYTSFDLSPQLVATEDETVEENPIYINGRYISWSTYAQNVRLYDQSGRLLQKTSGNLLEIPLAQPGLYILVLDCDGKTKSHKLIL